MAKGEAKGSKDGERGMGQEGEEGRGGLKEDKDKQKQDEMPGKGSPKLRKKQAGAKKLDAAKNTRQSRSWSL